jgi:hypothetical protein
MMSSPLRLNQQPATQVKTRASRLAFENLRERFLSLMANDDIDKVLLQGLCAQQGRVPPAIDDWQLRPDLSHNMTSGDSITNHRAGEDRDAAGKGV